MMRGVFSDFGMLKFYDEEYKTKSEPDWSKLDLSKLIKIIEIELERYAKTMIIWPTLVAIARKHREELFDLLNS